MEKTLSTTIIEFFGLENLPSESQKALVDQISGLVMKGLMMRIARTLTPTQSEKLEELLSKSSDAPAVVAFLETELPNFSAMITDELEVIKANMH